MKKIFAIMILSISFNTFSGPGHDHAHKPSDACKELATKDLKKSLIDIGKCHIQRLIKSKKIESSWSSAEHTKSISKKFKTKKEWVITFKNKVGIKAKMLYIFLNTKGGFIAANFTGK